MATLSISAGLSDTTIGLSRNVSASVTTTGESWDYRHINVGTSEETFTIDTDVGDAGWCLIINRDGTNFLEVGFATTVYSMKLKSGEFALFPITPAASALYLKADTAAVDVEVYVREA